MNTRIKAAFDRNQANAELPDVKVIWAGESALVFLPASSGLREPDASFSTRSDVVEQIKSFCVANDCRCSQIVNNRIQL